jgi:hypothetical protein
MPHDGRNLDCDGDILAAMDRMWNAWNGRQATVNARGLDLLLKFLSPVQTREFKETNSFIVVGSHSKRCYRIHHAQYYNVENCEDGICYCFLPSDAGICIPDVMLAQKIMLESDEHAAMLVANARPPLRQPKTPPSAPANAD